VLSDDEGPEFLGSLAEAAVGQHEMYESWVAAGFTPDQAMDLLKVVVAEIIRGAA
jgi:hypothetical protein